MYLVVIAMFASGYTLKSWQVSRKGFEKIEDSSSNTPIPEEKDQNLPSPYERTIEEDKETALGS